jgi:hypothetical protein
MEANDLEFPAFDIPLVAGAPQIPPETYARWISQNIARLRDSGQLDALCAARTPVNVRFKFADLSGS